MNLHDSGAGSLRAAIATATNGDTINFTHGLHGTISLTSGDLPISASVSINGPGANQLSVSGNDASRIFDISGSASVSIAGLTLTHGLAPSGGGILLEESAGLSLGDCTLTDNVALGYTAGGGFGGAIEDDSSSSGSLAVANSTFDNNRAIAIVANDSIVSTSYVFAAGGAIDLNLFGTGSATVTNSTFTGNEALGDSPGASAGGGALSNSSIAGASLTVTNCTINGNAAIGAAGGDGVSNFGSGQGGGINSIGTLTVRATTVTDNEALGAPMAADVVPSATVLANSASAGGGIFCLDLAVGPVLIADSTITGNQAVGGSGSAPAIGEGGGITLVLNPLVLAVPPSGLLTGCTVVNNTALGGSGNAGVAGADGVSGGIDLAGGSIVTVMNTTIAHNQAIGGAGGSGAAGGDGVGGAMNVGTGDVLFGAPDSCTLTLIGCTLNGNQAFGGAGGAGSNGGNGLGGGLSVLTGNAANVSTSVIVANLAQGGAAGTGGSDGQGVGGGVYNLGTFTIDVFSVIRRNDASTSNDNLFG
jgi:hypothetical protein